MKTLKLLVLMAFFTLCQLTYSPLVFATKSPIYIEANSMTSTENNNTVLFSGDVDAKQDDIRIRSEQMTVYYSSAGKKKKQEVEKIVCIKNVEVTRGEWLGTGQKMVYYANTKKIVLTDDAKAWQDQNMVSGEKITYYLDQKRSEVEGSGPKDAPSSRINMTIIQN